MKSFWCGAVIADCDARFIGRDENDVPRHVADHLPAVTVDRVHRWISDVSE
ncbi:DUF1059 domain-containing protein [Gordonia oryzae]|uniref:DUF1059 domain-containing protein n=1 Tax=Gordonia oryzae TaxID=2487349 RepID=A0A3N4GHH7_9ACTN|nr:DUF1059 domain-containing protein [Gordonia oryzae]RPA61158.1 DUF1059 domain-containing protein [Gordonia oryzae]